MKIGILKHTCLCPLPLPHPCPICPCGAYSMQGLMVCSFDEQRAAEKTCLAHPVVPVLMFSCVVVAGRGTICGGCRKWHHVWWLQEVAHACFHVCGGCRKWHTQQECFHVRLQVVTSGCRKWHMPAEQQQDLGNPFYVPSIPLSIWCSLYAVWLMQALEWWYTSAEEQLAAGKALPVPPPPCPPKPSPKGVGLPADTSRCPVCRSPCVNPAQVRE